jgi:CheY-like chemotaxis protein
MRGGRIWVESEPGVGSRFHFTAKFDIAQMHKTVIDTTKSSVVLNGVKVLIVDDNRTNRRILEGLLKRWGMSPTAVPDGEKALVELSAARKRNEPYRLILTDMHMPKMDGFQMVERIKETPELSAATIMMLTSGGQRGDADRCGELGISAYLLKPVRQFELREAISRVLQAKEQTGDVAVITQDALNEKRNAVSLQILLAEDNPVNQKLAIRLLEKRGHQVALVANGKDAVSAMEKRSYDLVLMDVQMPEMDGLEATRLLREREQGSGSHQAVVAMTALAMKGDRERCIAAGMDGYLSKPIRPQELDEVLDEYMAIEPPAERVKESGRTFQISVNTDELLERVDGDRGFISELLELFRGDYPRQIQEMRGAIALGDGQALQQVAHALKGALGNLSAPLAWEIAGELESMGRAGNIAQADVELQKLEAEMNRVIEHLEGLCLLSVQ